MKLIIALSIFSLFCFQIMETPKFYPKLTEYCQKVITEFDQIPTERKEELKQIAAYILDKQTKGQVSALTVICTHNSRRSHLGQVWLKVAAEYYGINHLNTYSGGTEATAFNIRAVEALRRAGLQIESDNTPQNPVYTISYSDNGEKMQAFSKKYTHEVNPSKDFCAVLVCSDADEACPVVKGTTARIAIPYIDPKIADGTPEETIVYDERCRQIAREMFWVIVEAGKGLKK
jgi:protein-tyrosine-phosphatase